MAARRVMDLLNRPQLATRVLIAVNVAIYAAMVLFDGSLTPSGRTMFRFGAMWNGALPGGEWWRLVSAGFLHFSILHLLFNMWCLLAWGVLVERRLGTAWFVLLYAVSLLAGNLVSALTHTGAYLGAGASGAIAGLLGALLYLALRGKAELPLQSVVLTVGLNAAFNLNSSGVDWRNHLGGFTAGIVVCLLLEAASGVALRVFRCKFPEWVKLDAVLTLPVLALLLHPESPVRAVLLLLETALVLKVVDLLLCLRRGVAMVAGGFLVVQVALLAVLASGAGPAGLGMAAALGCASLWLHWPPLRRGLRDQGFIAAGLQAERGRVRGL